jgi:hypothetical protein
MHYTYLVDVDVEDDFMTKRDATAVNLFQINHFVASIATSLVIG